MAQETKVEETRCSLQTFERNRYFYGKPMTVSDFEAEQRYLIGKHRYVNRLVHGAGVLCGLQVTVPDNFSADSPAVELAEGVALDCCGNLIVVSRAGTAEIKGDFDAKGVNYLYIKYAECSKQPVMSAANVASCEEVCCYNRIQETFEIVASPDPPSGTNVVVGAGGGTQASAAGPAVLPAAPAGLVKVVEATTDPAALCRALTEKYFQEHLRTFADCDDPRVFLAVLDMGKGAVDKAKTAALRSVVYNNPMLHEMLCDHVTDFNNPHRTTAAQVRALQSVNGVGNVGIRAFVANINLASKDKTVAITPDVSAARIDLILGPNAVRMSHLSEDVSRNLLQSNGTLIIEPDLVTKRISLRTSPAKKVTSVGGTQVVGTSPNYSPEDHAHDLAAGAVERRHLAEEVYDKLLTGGGIIKVTPDPMNRNIQITAGTSPAVDDKAVSSVTGTKRTGKSEKFAREDHAHDLRINGRSPDEEGRFVLTPGENVKIEGGAAGNELVISATGGNQTVIATGVFVFEGVRPQEVHTSPAIPHGLDAATVAVVIAEETVQRVRRQVDAATSASFWAQFGDVNAFVTDAPNLMATADYAHRTIQISLRDRREPQAGTTAPPERTYRIRWWAVPADIPAS